MYAIIAIIQLLMYPIVDWDITIQLSNYLTIIIGTYPIQYHLFVQS